MKNRYQIVGGINMFCKYCNHFMKRVMRFEDGKSYRFIDVPSVMQKPN